MDLDSPTYSLLRYRTGQSQLFRIDCLLSLVDYLSVTNYCHCSSSPMCSLNVLL
jgi:hypothetical protein